MSDRPRRLRRCQLSVPGSNRKMIEKAAALDVDYVFLDLEDAVAPNAKVAARKTVIEALNDLSFKAKTRAVRINDTSTPWCHGDIIDVIEGAGENIDVLILTKPRTPADIQFADMLMTQVERKIGRAKRVGLEALIEEVEGLINVEAIAASSPRLEALIFGMGDYSASQGMALPSVGDTGGYPGDIWYYPRFRITAACRAAGLDAVDGPFGDFRDDAAFREECRRALILGMAGKWAIHPSQVASAQECFTPKAEEVARARKLAKAYDDAQKKGEGAIVVDGVMVDAASVRLIRPLLAKADLIGL